MIVFSLKILFTSFQKLTMKVMIFIDGTWLWHNMMSNRQPNGNKIDLSKLPHLIIQNLYDEMNIPIYYGGTILCASIPINTDYRDYKLISKRRHFFEEILRNKCGFQVNLFEIDFRKHRLLKQDRNQLDTWEPKEKCVDIATATNLFIHANEYDIAVVITGDRDFLPALNGARTLGKQIKIASFQDSCSRELLDFAPNIIWLDDLLPEMILLDY